MTDNLVFCEPNLLSILDITMRANGYEDIQLEEADRLSIAETKIGNTLADWSTSFLSTGAYEETSYMSDGALLYESNGSSYHDNLAKSVDHEISVAGLWYEPDEFDREAYIHAFFAYDFHSLSFSDDFRGWKDWVPDWVERWIFPVNEDRIPDANGHQWWEPESGGRWKVYDSQGNLTGTYQETTQANATRSLTFNQNGSMTVTIYGNGGSLGGGSSSSTVFLEPSP